MKGTLYILKASEIVVIQLWSFICVLRFSSSFNCREINVKLTSIPCKVHIYIYFPFMTKPPFSCTYNTSFRQSNANLLREVLSSIKASGDRPYVTQAFCTPEPQYLMTQGCSFIKLSSPPFKRREASTAETLHHIHLRPYKEAI